MPRAREECPNFLPYHAALGSLTDVMEKNRRKKKRGIHVPTTQFSQNRFGCLN